MIDSDWIKARLDGTHGEKARLADAIGISRDKMSKVLNGTRDVQPDEIPKVLRFFGLQQLPVGQAFGFAEPSVEALLLPPSTVSTVIATLAPNTRHGNLYAAPKDYVSFGILAGDVLIVELNRQPEIGEIVIATINGKNTDSQATVLRRNAGNWLFSDDPLASPQPLSSPDEDVAVVGTVVASARPAKGHIIR